MTNNDYAYQPRAYDRDYGVNGLNQYTSVSEGNSIYALSYDMNGNLVSDGASSYGYDTENRLVSVQGPGTNVSYDYDPLGRLYAKRVNGTIIEKYVHDGDSIIADYSGTNQLIRRYIRGTGVDEIVGYLGYSGGSLSARRYVHSDYLGSIIATSNDGGQLVDTYRYSVYGEVDDPSGMPYRFTGRRYDGETNLYYYRARWYSPALGRFMQTDPIGYEDNINWYAYVNNDPINNTDPSGQVCVPCLGFLVGAGVELGYQIANGDFKNASLGQIAKNIGKIGLSGAAGAASGGIGVLTKGFSFGQKAFVGANLGATIGLTKEVGEQAINGELDGGELASATASGALTGGVSSILPDETLGVITDTVLSNLDDAANVVQKALEGTLRAGSDNAIPENIKPPCDGTNQDGQSTCY